MTVEDKIHRYNNYSVGQKIKCLKPTNTDRFDSVEAEIIGKYPNFALVSDKKSRWCVKWEDISIG